MKHVPQQRQTRLRSGISVAEVVIAATGVSVLSVIGITTVCLLMTAEQRAMESIVVDRTIAELADELRQDAHTSLSAEINDDGTELNLRQASETLITYACTSDGIHRSDATERNEDFHLPFGQSRFELSETGRLITCRHERDPTLEMSFFEPNETTAQPRRKYRIDAALLASDKSQE
ncbi:MAG: hypothetical protein KDA52_20850 [Planctomycetaceae bacterium]|nr:hypothetical protein [Planctomycetaceae bacterium]